MNKEIMKKLIEDQFLLPRRLYYFASRFPNVTFEQALRLYACSVEEILILHKAKHLYDEPLSFGRGLVYAKTLWLEKMQIAEQITIKGNNNNVNKY